MYISPANTRGLTLEALQRLTLLKEETKESALLPHLIMGDLNTTSWGELFDEWCGERSLRLISDPNAPTHKGEGVLDRILFYPGGYMPAAVFPQGEFRREDADERNRGDLHSPATVFPELALCDHFPLVLTLPCDHTRNLHKQGKMALDGLT